MAQARVFQVEDAGYFMNGWGIIAGDTIQLFGTQQKVMITDVDYATKTITVKSTVTWQQNQGVSLAYEGPEPDLGAYELPTTVKSLPPKNLRITVSPVPKS